MPKYRMLHVDHYMCKPVSPFDDLKSDITGKPTSKVPVIRIFGVDTNGRKICLHVHGYYPYVAIQNKDPNDKELPKKVISDIEKSLKQVVEENQNRQQQPQNQTGADAPRATDASRAGIGAPIDMIEQDGDSNLLARLHQERRPLTHLSSDQRCPIHRIESTKSFNYYGYHNKTEDFFKLYLYNPRMVKQLAQLFEDCRVLGRFIPVFWAHLPYILLFFIDNNLRGMQFIEVDQPYWRRDKAPRAQGDSPFSPQHNPNSTPTASTTLQDDISGEFCTDIDPISSCELEADIRFEWILNKQRFGSNGNDDALRELWLDDQEATQATSLLDPKLPLFDLEKDYIHQVCESYGVDYDMLDLELAEKPSSSQLRVACPTFDSDDSADFDNLLDREDVPEPVQMIEAAPLQAEPEVKSDPVAGPSGLNIRESTGADNEDEFSDDDEEFIKKLPKIVERIKVESEHELALRAIKREYPVSPMLQKTSIKTEYTDNVKPILIKRERDVTPNQSLKEKSEDCFSDDDDEFSDDDQFILQAVIKAESQDPVLKSQASPRKQQQQQATPIASATSSAATNRSFEDTPTGPLSEQQRQRRMFSDNSMIDGRSVVCSSTGRSKPHSQRSTSSARETVSHEYQYLCLMSMELHASTRGELRPDPANDPIEAIFYCIRNDAPETSDKPAQVIGMIITDPFKEDESFSASSPTVSSSGQIKSPGSRSNMSFVQKMRGLLHRTGLSFKDIGLKLVDTEQELIMSLIEVVKFHDPEILIGYEMEQLSWGYILERAQLLDISIGSALSRVADPNLSNNSKLVESTFVQPIMFTGRMVFSTWRIIRHEINLNTCSYERIHHHALNERVPCFAFETLTQWFNQHRNRWRVIDYYLIRVIGQMRILDRFDLIAKVSELARVYGTQFIDVITRGSQIGIESMMLRLAKLQNLTPLSPTVMQRNKMKAPEAIPLVMEPETNIYYDPVVVLDFQSLYPSVVIAYNYCYSTCLGRVLDLESKERHNFGCGQLYVDEDEIKRLLESNSVHISPCGVAYVKKNIRHGVLPKMLSELIITRAMVKDQMKKNMKSDRPNRRLQRILDHRQHGLKMMANTTYGYTGASYTGRMPCVEIADSIVSKGRETLENAIALVESRAEWGAKVIYGDTDSIFIQFKGCDRDTAFRRAYEMVDEITKQNPYPIKMKFEKIYQPCVLQTKKRYCGFKFESPEQTKPEFEAKGIETVRRDCCPAAARMLEMALRIQFTTRDVEQVRRYVQHQFIKIMSGKLSNLQDFIFARQYKPRDMDKMESVFVPAWQIAKRLLQTDPRAEPRVGERFPFVIIYGEPKTPLVNLAKTPLEVLDNLSYRVNADYYIQKIICPTLNRVFCTMGVDTLLWYKAMPHQNIIHRSHYLIAQKNQHSFASRRAQQSTMSQYFSPSHCPVCAKSIPVSDDVCDECRDDLQASVIRLTEEIARYQRKLYSYHQICRACSSLERCKQQQQHQNYNPNTSSDNVADDHYNPCISYDCQNLFRYHQAKLDALNSNYLSQVLKGLN